MTDDDVLALAPTACALVCAVHDADADTTHRLLDGIPTGTAALLVLMARLVPDRKTLRDLLADPHQAARDHHGVPLDRDDWPEPELRRAHAAWNRREHTPWAEAGEREYQRRRQVRRRARRDGTEGLTCPECGQAPRTERTDAA